MYRTLRSEQDQQAPPSDGPLTEEEKTGSPIDCRLAKVPVIRKDRALACGDAALVGFCLFSADDWPGGRIACLL
jgi:hypothetical protein